MRRTMCVFSIFCCVFVFAAAALAGGSAPEGWDPDAGPYLARGTWTFSGSGTATADGSSETLSISVSDGIARINSQGEAGSEHITHFREDCSFRLSSTNGFNHSESLHEDYPVDVVANNNYLTYSEDGVVWEYYLLDESTAKMRTYGTLHSDGYTIHPDIWYTAHKVSANPDANVDTSGGGGCSVASPALSSVMLLLPLVLLLRRR